MDNKFVLMMGAMFFEMCLDIFSKTDSKFVLMMGAISSEMFLDIFSKTDSSFHRFKNANYFDKNFDT